MKALVLLADGTEEMEAVIPIDLMRRAKWEVVAAGLKKGAITASRGVRIVPDAPLDRVDAAGFDLLVVPGGAKGVQNLRKDARVLELVRAFDRAGKTVAAICAGPLVLQEAGILDGKRATCHPDVTSQLTKAKPVDEAVVVDGRVVTSQGAGTSFRFALTLIERLDSKEKADAVARGIVLR